MSRLVSFCMWVFAIVISDKGGRCFSHWDLICQEGEFHTWDHFSSCSQAIKFSVFQISWNSPKLGLTFLDLEPRLTSVRLNCECSAVLLTFDLLAFSSWQVLAQHKVNVFSSLALRGSSYTVPEMYYPQEKTNIYIKKKNRLQLDGDDFESVSGKYRPVRVMHINLKTICGCNPSGSPLYKAWKPDTGSPFSRTPFGLKARVAPWIKQQRDNLSGCSSLWSGALHRSIRMKLFIPFFFF